LTEPNLSADPSLLQAEGALLRGGAEWVRFLSGIGQGAELEQAFEARNFLLDEGICEPRVDSYGDLGAMADHPSYQDWQGVHTSYLEERVFRLPAGDGLPRVLDSSDEIACPETFRFIDPASPFLVSDPKRSLVRIERLRFVAEKAGVAADVLKGWATEATRSQTSDSIRLLNQALDTWARNIDARPMYAAFLDDLEAVIGVEREGPPGWAEALRDALGLLHLDPGDRRIGGSIDILVFRYPVKDVPRLSGGSRDERPLLSPTVLDNWTSPAFLPAPRGSLTGHVVDLSGAAPNPRREVLHPGVPFQAKHLWRVGTISQPVDRDNLSIARGLHLALVRQLSGRDDYGRGTDGDLS
jgi:hypothetical protein